MVFLDIGIQEGNGFSLLESLPEIHFEVIFVTAYDPYEIQAIKFSALDYILKPTDIDGLLAPYRFLRVHQSHLINLNEVKSYIKSDGGYIRMKDGAGVSISRQRKEWVLKILTGKIS